MKKILTAILLCALLCGCGVHPLETVPPTEAETLPVETQPPQSEIRGDVVDIRLDGQNITVSGDGSGVFTSRDIIYYENKLAYQSGRPYGDGQDWERHSREEAGEHLVVNITAPGNYRVSGSLEKGQLRIDLGEEAYSDPNAVVNLILDGVEINCTVGPAILFQNVYECDGEWSAEAARPDVDTLAAGANLILAEGSRNIVHGSHVAKIYQDKEGEKKLYKQDGAIYSYMSMNIWGPGALELYADNEGMDTELHLTVWGGDISICSGNDGINTNEDGVSVTAIHGGNLRINAGLGAEGDGIDSNGYLMIYGGTVVAAAHPASDAGLDSDRGSFIHGGTVIALGAAMDWAESDSGQVTMNLQFTRMQTGDIRVTREDGSEVFSFDPAEDAVIGLNNRSYQGAIISCPGFRLGEGYHVFVGGAQMGYLGTDMMLRPGETDGPGNGQRPEGGPQFPGGPGGQTPPGDMPQPPEGDFTIPPQPPEGTAPAMPQGTAPEGTHSVSIKLKTVFLLEKNVNFFYGLMEAE